MTTDTHAKEVVVAAATGSPSAAWRRARRCSSPNMATMLAVLTTDAEATPDELKAALTARRGRLVQRPRRRRLHVDQRHGAPARQRPRRPGRRPGDLDAAVAAACADLAAQMAGDAEGATKVVRLPGDRGPHRRRGAVGARAVARSQLVKCSWYGRDPYWGRIASDLGSLRHRASIRTW